MKYKALILLIIAVLVGSLPMKSQSVTDLWEENMYEYLKYVDSKNSSKAFEALSEAIQYNEKARIDKDFKVIVWYLYLSELIKHNPQSDDILKYCNKITAYGPRLNEKPDSYALELISANAYIIIARTDEGWTPYYLAKALLHLERLKTENVRPKAEKDYEPFYELCGLSVSEKERQVMLDFIIAQSASISGQKWYNAAENAHNNSNIAGNPQVALKCVQMSESMGYDAAKALHGYMYEMGKVVEKDLRKAFNYYKEAAKLDVVWGKVKYAQFLLDGEVVPKDYDLALSLLSSARTSPSFLRLGGAYQLGRMYEHGWGVDVDLEAALVLYTDSYDNCIFSSIVDQSYQGSLNLENMLAEDIIDKEISELDVQSMTAAELAAISRRYDALNSDEKAYKYALMAAEKGSAFVAFQLAMLFYDNSDDEDQKLLTQALHFFEIGKDYAPCKYNLAIMYLYGDGTSPDHDKALDLYNMYIEQIEKEGYADYSEEDYLLTITGFKYNDDATKRAIPLAKELQDFSDPNELYSWAMIRERDSRPEIPIYFYNRAIKLGHPKAAERLAIFQNKLKTN